MTAKKENPAIIPNIFARSDDVFPVEIPFEGVDLVFTMRKLGGGVKWGVYQDCLSITAQGPKFNFRAYFNKMISLMVVNGPTGKLTENEVDDLYDEIRGALEARVPSPNVDYSSGMQDAIKKA